MKHTKKKELDVDFIGDQQPLTKEEEKAISDYFAKQLGPKNQLSILPAKREKRKVIV